MALSGHCRDESLGRLPETFEAKQMRVFLVLTVMTLLSACGVPFVPLI